MTNNLIVALTACLFLSSCKHDDCHSVDDSALRTKIFQQCIGTMSKQPNHNHEDNNGHIVEACDDAARRQSHQFVCKEKEGFDL